MAYVSTKLRTSIQVSHIVTIHYFEYMKDFYFAGEAHNFWEILCVDKGTVQVQANGRTYELGQGDLIFHKPMEFHSIKSLGGSAPNLIAISFLSPSIAMKHLEDKCFILTPLDKLLISKIISEASSAFSTPLNVPSIEQVKRSEQSVFGAEQMIKLYLEELLIGFIRRTLEASKSNPSSTTKLSKDRIFENLVTYLEAHIREPLNVSKICSDNLISKSSLQDLFHEKVGSGVMEYFNCLKINLAKRLIREGMNNFTQIADHLAYSSLPHFSRQFKKVVGMSPTEYAVSIKFLSENMNHHMTPLETKI